MGKNEVPSRLRFGVGPDQLYVQKEDGWVESVVPGAGEVGKVLGDLIVLAEKGTGGTRRGWPPKMGNPVVVVAPRSREVYVCLRKDKSKVTELAGTLSDEQCYKLVVAWKTAQV
jgi:hypothetical protein